MDEPRAVELIERGLLRHSILEFAARWEAGEPEPSLPTYVRPTLPLTALHLPRRFDGKCEERELPQQLYADLHELAPQALLRDLHRPVKSFFVELERQEVSEVLGILQAECEKLREARRLEPLPEIEPSVLAMAEQQRRRRSFMAERWQPLLPDDAPRKEVVL